MIGLLSHYLHVFIKHFKQKDLRKIVYTTLILIVAGSLAFYWFERAVNPRINDFGDALWLMFVTLATVGYGDLYPITIGGRLVSVLVMLAGIGLVTVIVGIFASIIQNVNLKREMGKLVTSFQDHLIICGWSEKTEQIIEEVHCERKDSKQPVVLIADKGSNPLEEDEMVHFIQGKIDSEKILEKAGVKRASSAVVLNQGDDATTVLSCMTIRKMNPNIYIVAEVNKSENRSHFEMAKVDEIVVNQDINSRLLIRSALHSGIAHIIEELTTATHGNEIYKIQIRDEWVGETYSQLYLDFYNDHNAILLGIVRDNKVLTNPGQDTVCTVKDEFFYIAQDKLKL